METKTREHDATRQVASKAHEAIERAAKTAGKAEDYAREHISDAAEHIREATAKGREQAEEVQNRVNGYVRENPLLSLGIAFIFGVLYSWLTGRR